MLTIGAFAELSGVSAKALRAYDDLGLFKPAWVDRATRYRLYSPAQLPQIRRIAALRALGMSLADIERLVSGGEDLRTVLKRRREALERDRHTIDARLAALDIHVEVASTSDQMDVVLRPIPAQAVATLVLALVPSHDVEEAFYELEAYVRDAGRRAARPPGAIVPDRGDDVEIFVPLNGPIPSNERIECRRLPAIRAATALHRGSYQLLPTVMADLENWVRRMGLAVAGPLRIVYLQFGAEPELRVPSGYVVGSRSDYLTELQLPVTGGAPSAPVDHS